MENLTIDCLSEANQFRLHHGLGHGWVVRQAVEHEGDELGHVQDGKLTKKVWVNCTDVLQKDNLKRNIMRTEGQKKVSKRDFAKCDKGRLHMTS